MRFTFDVHLPQPRPEVFAFLSDPDNRPRWQSSLRKVERVDAGPPRLGLRWRDFPLPYGTFDLKISEFERDTLWTEDLRSAAAEGLVRLRFDDDAEGGTRLAVEGDISFRGAWRLVEPAASWLLPQMMKRDLERAGRVLAQGEG